MRRLVTGMSGTVGPRLAEHARRGDGVVARERLAVGAESWGREADPDATIARLDTRLPVQA